MLPQEYAGKLNTQWSLDITILPNCNNSDISIVPFSLQWRPILSTNHDSLSVEELLMQDEGNEVELEEDEDVGYVLYIL